MTTDPTVRSQELGDELRTLRVGANCSLRDAGRHIDASASKLSRIETGNIGAGAEDGAALLVVYGVTGPKRRELLDLAREAERRGWWQRDHFDLGRRQRTLVSLEAKADTITDYASTVIPGLLQTGEYTREIMTRCGYVPHDQIEQRMASRLRRHSILRKPDRPNLSVLIDQSVLHRTVGDSGIMRRQLDYLAEATQWPNITVRIVPNDGRTQAGIDGSFILLYRAGFPSVVFVESLTSGLFLETPSEVDKYKSVLRDLSQHALDEQHSVETLAQLAIQLDTETSTT